MSAPHGFTLSDAEELTILTYEGDSAGLTTWLADHILTVRDMHALLEFLPRMIAETWPLALTKHVPVGQAGMWALEDHGSTPPARDAARMMTAAMNSDHETLTALILAVMSHDPEHHAAVTAHLLKAWGSGLRAITATSRTGTP